MAFPWPLRTHLPDSCVPHQAEPGTAGISIPQARHHAQSRPERRAGDMRTPPAGGDVETGG